jgi:hypothetical protein
VCRGLMQVRCLYLTQRMQKFLIFLVSADRDSNGRWKSHPTHRPHDHTVPKQCFYEGLGIRSEYHKQKICDGRDEFDAELL